MLKTETDWVEIFSQEIFATGAALTAYCGLQHQAGIYRVGQRQCFHRLQLQPYGCHGYYYSLSLANKSATSRQADLVEERQEFTFMCWAPSAPGLASS